MDNQNYTDIGGAVGAMPAKGGGGKKRILVMVLVAVLVLALLGGAGWYYYDSSNKVEDQKAKISELEAQIGVLEGRPAQDASAADEEEAEEAVAATCAGGSSYSATVGKFDLTLSDPNVVIRSLDGNFEGGPITSLSIGQCVEGQMNVVDSTPTETVSITGHPSSTAAELQAAFEANWGSALTPDSTVTIDGVTANTFTGDGLFTTKLVYFDNNSIGYEIELSSVNDTTEDILTDIIADWDFTP